MQLSRFFVSLTAAAATAAAGASQNHQSLTQSHSQSQSHRTLYVSHYDGHIYTLNFDIANPNPQSSLTLSNSLQACGSMPSWLTLDSSAKLLYCINEAGTSQSSGNGSLTSFDISSTTAAAAAENPKLLNEVATLAGGVASVVYEVGKRKFFAIAHYEGSSVSTFALPITNSSSALQTFEFTLTGPVTVPDRQDAPHPHDVIIDPTNSYILTPDLGADLIRIFAIDTQRNDGTLIECEPHKTTPGNGPRHAVFNHNVLYVTNELADSVSTYSVSYRGDSDSDSNSNKKACALSLQLQQEFQPGPNNTLPANSYVAEIRLVENTCRQRADVYVSVRGDQGFAPDDSIAFLDATSSSSSSASPAFSLQNLTSSFGSFPRTLVISDDGEYVAVGNQKSSSVAIVQRDSQTGQLGALLGNLQVGSVSAGLSSVIWGSD